MATSPSGLPLLCFDLPDSYSADDVVNQIQRRLRQTYPLAIIRVEPRKVDGGAPTWHVQGDGLTQPA